MRKLHRVRWQLRPRGRAKALSLISAAALQTEHRMEKCNLRQPVLHLRLSMVEIRIVTGDFVDAADAGMDAPKDVNGVLNEVRRVAFRNRLRHRKNAVRSEGRNGPRSVVRNPEDLNALPIEVRTEVRSTVRGEDRSRAMRGRLNLRARAKAGRHMPDRLRDTSRCCCLESRSRSTGTLRSRPCRQPGLRRMRVNHTLTRPQHSLNKRRLHFPTMSRFLRRRKPLLNLCMKSMRTFARCTRNRRSRPRRRRIEIKNFAVRNRSLRSG